MASAVRLVSWCWPLLVAVAQGAQDSRTSQPADPIEAALAHARTTADEDRWRAIPWRHSLTDTLAEAKRTERAVFLFGADGDLWAANC